MTEPRPLPRRRRVLVTGAAGFIGSHTCDALLQRGDDVVGIDAFTEYYPREAKERNVAHLRDWGSFELAEVDLAEDDLVGLLEGIDVVIHLAARPGVRHGFGDVFRRYLRDNVLATQRLLDEAAASPVDTLVYASSSSVYGDAARQPTDERAPLAPVSPYGMTKVSVEQLAGLYHRCYGVPAVGLRFFTVYGPRQRPDMAFHRFITRCLDGEPMQVNGDGRQVRDFTYVGDAVEAILAATERGRPGATYNVGGGRAVELKEPLELIAALAGVEARIERRPGLVGEAQRTECDGTLARRELGFTPRTPLAEGIAEQFAHTLHERRSTSSEEATRAGA